MLLKFPPSSCSWHIEILLLPVATSLAVAFALMLLVVLTVSLLVQVYSQGYMKDDPGYHRYYAWMSLFTTAMLGLVMADSLLLAFMFWELVGLCSYLLIGFWYEKERIITEDAEEEKREH